MRWPLGCSSCSTSHNCAQNWGGLGAAAWGQPAAAWPAPKRFSGTCWLRPLRRGAQRLSRTGSGRDRRTQGCRGSNAAPSSSALPAPASARDGRGPAAIANVVRGVGQLLLAELLNPSPITALGLLIEVHAHQLTHHSRQAMAGAVGASQAAGHLGAEDRIHGNAKAAGHGRHVKRA